MTSTTPPPRAISPGLPHPRCRLHSAHRGPASVAPDLVAQCWREIEAIGPTTPRFANTADPGASPSAFDSNTGSSLGHIGCLCSMYRAASLSSFVASVLGFLFRLPRDASPRHRPPASSRRPRLRQTWQWIGCLVLFAVAIGGEQEDTVEALSRAVQRSGSRGGIKGHRWRQHAIAACGGETEVRPGKQDREGDVISMQENMSARTLTLSSSTQQTIVRFVKLPLVDKITAWIFLEKLLVFLCSYVLQSADHGHYFVIFMAILRRLNFMHHGSCKYT
ncbi:hypothetical protein ZEAMMB73_Zm00001d021215 [Zea mays]|uniref:Uncharacterized protein n=1 Tax=Zea mays TaxID=4577 RepID=A0A1D6I944_MAIZE|nr:hypothetical protein ZEAMMB73_Zm00001d021215 [Zea mays]